MTQILELNPEVGLQVGDRSAVAGGLPSLLRCLALALSDGQCISGWCSGRTGGS